MRFDGWTSMTSMPALPEGIAPVQRTFTKDFKRSVVEASFLPGASVAALGREYSINDNLIFKWRSRYFRGEFGQPAFKREGTAFVPLAAGTLLLPITITPDTAPVAQVAPVTVTGSIELSLRQKGVAP
jgi:transposase